MKKIVHYSKSDLSYGHNLNECARYIDGHDRDKPLSNIDDAFKLYNIKKYIDDNVHLEDWSDEQMNRYFEFGKSIPKLLGRYLGQLELVQLPELYKETDRRYRRDFFILLAEYGVHLRIDKEILNKILERSHSWKNELLASEKFVKAFDKCICNALCADSGTAELVLNQYEVKHITENRKLYFPVSFNHKRREVVLNQYIDSSDPNLNYVRLIGEIQSNKDRIVLNRKTIKRARERAVELEEEIFKEGQGLRNHITVAFSDKLNEEFDVKIEATNIYANYSKRWIEQNLDYPTVLNNFIYLFEFTDMHMRCTLVNLLSAMGVLERFMGVKSKYAYNTGISYRVTNQLAIMQLNGYYTELLRHEIRLEEVIEWFFQEYLKDEFKIHNYYVSMPSEGSTMLEKCSNIMPAFESVLKQFSLYVEENEIDHELLEIGTDHLFIDDVPSLNTKKYFYLNGDDSKTICHLLFSNQTAFGYLERLDNEYDNLYELLRNEKIRVEDFENFGIDELKWLVENEIIHERENGVLDFVDVRVVKKFKELYFNEVISYWHYSQADQVVIDELYDKDLLRNENTLFSIPECEYFDFHLNKARFNNGLDLRNRYSHTQVISIQNPEIHRYNYLQFLKLFIITLIKINDDICIFYSNNRNDDE